MALGAQLGGNSFHTWVMLGDGEIQEGMVWEAVQVAARYKLDNLTAIVDRNGLQQFGLPSTTETTRTDRGDRRDPWFGVDLPRYSKPSAGGSSRLTDMTLVRSRRPTGWPEPATSLTGRP